MQFAHIICKRISHGVVIGGYSRLAAASLLLKFKAPYDPFFLFIFFTCIVAISMNSVEPS